MLSYIVRRILLAVPTLLIISLITFGLSKCAPKDSDLEYNDGGGTMQQQEADIRVKAAKLGLDKPSFYCALTSAALPDTLYKVLPLSRRERLAKMTSQTGNWGAIKHLDDAVQALWERAKALSDTLPQTAAIRADASILLVTERLDTLEPLFGRLAKAGADLPAFRNSLDSVRQSVRIVQTQQLRGKNWIPALHWYGFDNQYHHWLAGFVTGDLGLTRGTEKDVLREIKPALIASLVINVLALLLAYLGAVPLGVYLARRRNGSADRLTRGTLLFLYAMPAFWLGGLLILFFATPGMGLSLIHGITVAPLDGKFVPVWFLQNGPKFILPVLTLTLHTLAVLTLQMRGGVLEVLNQDYIRTARAKGAHEKTVYWRHAFRNALFPIITVFAGAFPALFAGSLVVESIFQYPGMGLKTQEAFQNFDYPLLFAILMMASALTIIGNLIADMLYAWADPRVRF